MIDASDIGAGAVLQQEDSEGIDHSVCYFSKKSAEILYDRKGSSVLVVYLTTF